MEAQKSPLPGTFEVLVLSPVQESNGNRVKQKFIGGNFEVHSRNPDLG